jgi:hypothetical protein
MEGKSIFIRSCSRRQLYRRRPQARTSAMRLQLMLALLVLMVGLAAFIAGHGGL